ncbi:hypothetical protein STCU_09009 [Strigomonas culicis]|uniref:Uncharacterized protein n=1 Tax=Strigomonas culicis TaxID=28005 RepID=S9V0G5_9TRYP|nr:hypothetical protein STCU_09009 [Strigomonas culicis]|eukprot:EPY20401.1 hypothetical protein STCU_09009 [Strigomonas culicis]
MDSQLGTRSMPSPPPHRDGGGAAQTAHNHTAIYATDEPFRGERSPPSALLEDEVDVAVQHYFAAIKEKDEDIFRLYEDNRNIKKVLEASIAKREELTEMYTSQVLLVHALQAEVKEKAYLLDAQEKENHTLREAFSRLRQICGKEAELHCDAATLVDEVADVFHARQEWLHGLHYAKRCIEGLQMVALQTVVAAEADARSALAVAEADAREGLVGPSPESLFAHDAHHWHWVEHWAAEAEVEADTVGQQIAHERHDHARAVAALEEELQRALAAHAATDADRLALERENVLLKTLLCDRQEESDLLQPMLLGRVELLQRRCAAAEYAWKDLYWNYYKKESKRYYHLTEELSQERAARAAAEETRAQLSSKLRRAEEAGKGHQQRAEALAEELAQARAQADGVQRKYAALLDREGKASRQHEALRRRYQTTADELEEALKKKTQLQERHDERAKEAQASARQVGQLKRQIADLHAAHTAALADGCLAAARGARQVAVDHHDALLRAFERQARAALAAALQQVAEAQREAAATREEAQRRREGEAAEVQHWLALTETLKGELAGLRQTAAREQAARAALEEAARLQGRAAQQLALRAREDDAREAQALRHQRDRLEHHVAVLHKACQKSTQVIAGLRAALQREKDGRPRADSPDDSGDAEGLYGGWDRGVRPSLTRVDNTAAAQGPTQRARRSAASEQEVYSMFLVDKTNVGEGLYKLVQHVPLQANTSPREVCFETPDVSADSSPRARKGETVRLDNSALQTSISKLHMTIQGLNRTPSKDTEPEGPLQTFHI